MKNIFSTLKIAILLIILSFSNILMADESLEPNSREPQSESESPKTHWKGPVFSPLKVKPYTKRIYRA